MATVCYEISEWVEEEVLEPVKRKKEKAKEKCKKKKCKWWCACCNKWKCWIEIVIYWITEWVVRIVGKWVVRVLCEIVSTILRAAKELANRLVGILDFIGSLLGIRPKKYLRLKVFILVDENKKLVQNKAEVQRWVDFTKKAFLDKMNVQRPCPIRS